MVALDQFDFNYGPLYGAKWPSIRLGLTTPNKYICVGNTLSEAWYDKKDDLVELGAYDLTADIAKKHQKRQIKARKIVSQVPSSSKNPEPIPENQENSEEDQENEEAMMRSSLGLDKFVESSGHLSLADLQMNKREQLIGVQYQDADPDEIPLRRHTVELPTELKVFTFPRGSISDFPMPPRGSDQIPGWWLMDGASLIPVLALDLKKGETMLDMCAAPGGKSLISLLTKLPDKIVSNDFKLSRLGDLKRSLAMYVPMDSEEAGRVIIKRKNASNWDGWDELKCYDKVLADVPCSTDRLAVSFDEGNIFAAKHTQERLNLPQLQMNILVNAIRSCRVGGSVVYSTCTLSPIQNESVIEKAAAMVKHNFGIDVIEESLSDLFISLYNTGMYQVNTHCRRGYLILPFLPSNFGPMYVCKLTRLS
ncbi:hypothetical protein WR25_25360 [Diploscapter pachys]|uniref:NOL1/NOP2/Sun domain family member 4 n=1 Tax=Diploscapter pachys TaxID=2018661 RepID=A0A2A2JRH1_9BILA|nr:hypothetical protein WR25_25360 [Diploscapter pachys]